MCDNIYLERNSYWLPEAYLNNAKCACSSLPDDDPQAKCIRQFLGQKLETSYSQEFKSKWQGLKNEKKDRSFNKEYVPRIYDDHVQAYTKCLCKGKPAFFYAWLGVSCVDLRFCGLVKSAITTFGSCDNGIW